MKKILDYNYLMIFQICILNLKKRNLPKSRTEFESRASLFQILNDFERFIKIKREFYINEQDMLD